MLIEGQMIKIKVVGKTLNHYLEKGYNVVSFQDIYVKAEDLTYGSHAKVQVQCDYCGDIFERTFKNYKRYHKEGKDCCKKCCHTLKAKETCLAKYGVSNPMQLESVKTKLENTINDRYGVSNIGLLPEHGEKIKKTLMKKYGVSCVLDIPGVREKTNQTNIERYGVKWAGSAQEVIKKRTATINGNQSQKCSKQQKTIYKNLKEQYKNIELNYPVSTLFLDIALFVCDEKIDIEYDGWYWHKNKISDRRRDEYLKSQGWKILRIKSGHKTPTLDEINFSINKLLNGYKYTEIVLDDWKEDMA